MKITCLCGETISDAGDALPDKAWLLADQDYAAITEQTGTAELVETRAAAMRPVRQCWNCGRLCLDDPVTGSLVWYRPEADPRRNVLGSIKGNSYRVALIGTWQDWQDPPRGDLFWGTSGDLAGGYETFASLDELERRYHAVRAQLHREGRLGRAWLHRGEVTLHKEG